MEMASDLSRYHHRRIADWHQGSLSSRELIDELFGIVTETIKGEEYLVGADFLPEDSAFNTALRGGDWTEDQYRQARIAATLAVSLGGSYQAELSPAQKAAEKAHEEWLIKRHAENLAQLRGEGR